MQLQKQRIADEFRWLHRCDLVPEEFLSWVLEWAACALRARLANAPGKAERVLNIK